ncbi:MAG: aldose epimerase family protein [Paracoccus sp. (in: a-proteobacteria)]|uniref:aldose epimerase family protein n=1 Tax=Paracoccus sp. TaxID=267 RepID=UPI0039E6E65F
MTLFGTLPDGSEVHSSTISAHGMTISVMTLGASLIDLRLAGVDHPLVLGFPELVPYLTAHGRYFGAIVGRMANRIAHGRAGIDGRQYQFDRNEAGRNTLHGGSDGSGSRNWRRVDLGRGHISFSDRLPEGHMGFPGALLVRASYRIQPGPRLEIEILASALDTTLCNFAQHSYFNLDGTGTVAQHRLSSPATQYLPVDEWGIPLGAPAPVQGSHMDFRQPTLLAERLSGPVIDHNLCLHPRKSRELRPAARLRSRRLTLDIASTEPGLQVYAGHHIRPGPSGLSGRPYQPHAGIALESQLWPDAPNHPQYPSALLPLGQIYRQTTSLSFGGNPDG